MVALPRVYQALAALFFRWLSPRSRFRQAMLRRQFISGYAAATRRDYQLMLVRYAPDVVVEFDPAFEPLGLSGIYRGHEGFLELLGAWGESWERWEVVPVAVVDMGDRVLGLGHTRLPGTASGLELEGEFAQLITVKRGLAAYSCDFASWEKGLRAAGLDPDATALPDRTHGRTPVGNHRSDR